MQVNYSVDWGGDIVLSNTKSVKFEDSLKLYREISLSS